MVAHSIAPIVVLIVSMYGVTGTRSRPSIKVTQEMVDKINSENRGWKAAVVPEWKDWTEEEMWSLVDTHRSMKELMKLQEDFQRRRTLREEEGRSSRIKRQAPIDIPDEFDGRFVWPFCPDIGTEGSQGSCSASALVAVAAAASDRICIHSRGRVAPTLSAQDLLECCDECGKCAGGESRWSWGHWTHVGIPTGGYIETHELCKPYIVHPSKPHPVGECHAECQASYNESTYEDEKLYYKGLTNYSVPTTMEDMQREIIHNGPIVAQIGVFSDFYAYASGVYKEPTANFIIGSQTVKVIGWGQESGIDYWLCVNSWSYTWGYSGIFKYHRGVDLGGIESLHVTAGFPQYYVPDASYLASLYMATDMVIVIDVSLIQNSPNPFRAALSNLLQHLLIERDNYFNLAIILYSDTVTIRLEFQPYQSLVDINGMFMAITAVPSGGATPHRLDLAIDAARDLLITQAREYAAWVIFAIVGPSHDATLFEKIKASSDQAKADGILMSVMGVNTMVDRQFLASLASRDICSFVSDITLPGVPESRLYYAFPIFLEVIAKGIATCSNILMKNGLRNVPVLGECDSFNKCRFPEDKNPVKIKCPRGTLWDPNLLTCNWPSGVNCRTDPCKRNTSLGYYAVTDQCRLYWECYQNGTHALHCCDELHSFDDVSQTCVADPNCTEKSCQERGMRPIDFFYDDAMLESRYRRCKADFRVTFAGGKLTDRSQHSSIIDNYGTELTHEDNLPVYTPGAKDKWVAHFTGSEYLAVTFFTNNYYGNKLQVYVRFQPNLGTTFPVDLTNVLVTNGGQIDADPSIFIGYNRQYQEVRATLETTTRTSELFVDASLFQFDKYVEIWLTYDGAEVILCRNDEDGVSKLRDYASNSGWVTRMHNALHIGGYGGSTNKYIGFAGIIDEVWVSRCILEEC